MKVTFCDICGQTTGKAAFTLRVGGNHASVVIEDFEICEACKFALVGFIRARRAEAEPAPHVVVFQKELPS